MPRKSLKQRRDDLQLLQTKGVLDRIASPHQRKNTNVVEAAVEYILSPSNAQSLSGGT